MNVDFSQRKSRHYASSQDGEDRIIKAVISNDQSV